MELAARIGTMARRGAPLPYDAEVEYLESTGTQYIDTEIVFYNVKTIIRFALTRVGLPHSDAYICASWNPNGNRYPVVMLSYDKLIIVHDKNLSRIFTHKEDALIHSVVYNDNGKAFFDDNYAGSTPVLNPADVSNSIALFCYHTYQGFVQPSTSRIFNCTFINNDNGKTIRDFIPVRFTNESGVSEGAMYDRVSGQLFRNEGTGAFLIGPDVVSSRGGGTKCLTLRRSYRRSSRPSARFCAHSHRWEVAA